MTHTKCLYYYSCMNLHLVYMYKYENVFVYVYIKSITFNKFILAVKSKNNIELLKKMCEPIG